MANDYDDAIEEVHYRYRMCVQPNTSLDNRAHHLVELANAIGNLSTWHSGYDYESGTLPWEREDEDA